MTRTRRPRGTITERSPGSWRIRISGPRDPITGKRSFSTKTVRGTLTEAKRELTQLLKAADDGTGVKASRITVGEWLDTWIGATRAQVSGKTHERYAEIVRCHLKPALGRRPLQRLTTADIQKAYGEFDRHPSPRTRRHIHRILKSALARAVAEGKLGRNPALPLKEMRLPKVEPKPVNTLTVADSMLLLAAIRHTTSYWPVLIALATGMRRGEILALRWKNLELDGGAGGTVRVVESLEQTKAGLRFKSTKSEKARAVPLPASHWLSFAIGNGGRRRRCCQDGETLVCARADGQPKQPDSLTHEFTYLVGRVDVPRVRFHDLRHSHATQLLAAGVHPKIVQERLGHSTITITLDLYSHVSDTMQAGAVAQLDGAYGTGLSK